MATDLTKISFDSRLNYLKRSEFVGSQDVTLGGAGATNTVTVTHNLGYIPFFTVASEMASSTIVWSNEEVHLYTGKDFGAATDVPMFLNYWIDDTELTINLVNGEGTETESGTRTIHWAIYLDYSGA